MLLALALASAVSASPVDTRAGAADLAALQQGIEDARASGLFPNGVDEVDVYLVDAEHVYLWTKSGSDWPKTGDWNGYSIHRLAHGGKPSERNMQGCRGGAPEVLKNGVPRGRYRFNCAPLSSFTAIQKAKPGSIYDTRESYLATVTHEYAHQYMYQELYQIPDLARLAPLVKALDKSTGADRALSEAYAIWNELLVSKKLYPDHFRRLKADARPERRDPHSLGLRAALELLKLAPE